MEKDCVGVQEQRHEPMGSEKDENAAKVVAALSTFKELIAAVHDGR